MKKAARLVLGLLWASIAENLGLKKPVAQLAERIHECKGAVAKAMLQKHGLDAYLALCQLIAVERDKGFGESLTWLTAKKRASKWKDLVSAVEKLQATLEGLDTSLTPNRHEERIGKQVTADQVYIVDRQHGVPRLTIQQHKEADNTAASAGITSFTARECANYIASDLSRQIAAKVNSALEQVIAAALAAK